MDERVRVSPDELLGDGVFETIHLRPAGPWLLDAHLERLARSAALLDMPLDPPDVRTHRCPPGATEAALRIICTRRATHVTVSAIPAATLRERRDGVRLISADTGVALGGRPPWSLGAAKTLSYAENLAARRWARGRGADDLLWLTTDGYALEAPTASLVWLADDTLCTVAAGPTGILPGTTAAALLAAAPSVGLRTAERLVTRDDLAGADGIWLASALRGLAEAVTLDGVPRPRSPWTGRLTDLLGY